MSPQDSMLLQDFLNQLVQARDVPKDPEAEAMIARAVAQQPDAAYLLVQRALLQQQALNNAQAEIAALQQQLRGAPRSAPEFLDPNAWGHGGQRSPAAAHGALSPSAQYDPPAYQQPARGGFFGGRMGGMGGGMGGALGTIASTAAGVAAGAFLFQGLGKLLGGNHDGNGFLGNDNAFSSLTEPLDNLNNNLGNNLGADLGGNDTASGLADSSASEHDFSGDSGGDNFSDDGFDGGGGGGGGDSMLG